MSRQATRFAELVRRRRGRGGEAGRSSAGARFRRRGGQGRVWRAIMRGGTQATVAVHVALPQLSHISRAPPSEAGTQQLILPASFALSLWIPPHRLYTTNTSCITIIIPRAHTVIFFVFTPRGFPMRYRFIFFRFRHICNYMHFHDLDGFRNDIECHDY